MEKDITFKNRDGRTIVLRFLEEHKYAFDYEDYLRVGFADTESEDICFIDPSGGPFMAVGNMVDGKQVITKITDDESNKCYVLETKNNY